MTTPIPDLPEVPLPSQNRPDFEETVETFLLSLQPWADAANVLGDEMEALAGGTSGDAASAAASAEAAALSALSIVDYNGTSNTSLTIGAGSHELTVDVGKRWVGGTWVTVVDMADPATNFMDGRVVSYDDETGAMEIYVEPFNFGGSGTYTAWVISLSARQKDVSAQVAAAEAAQAAAEGFKDEAAQSAAYAGGFETPEYADQATGNTATTAGQIFRVPKGTTPQTFDWYRRLVSGSELVDPLATKSLLASTASGSGAALLNIGQTTVRDRIRSISVSITEYGAQGTADCLAAFNAALADVKAAGGGTIVFPFQGLGGWNLSGTALVDADAIKIEVHDDINLTKTTAARAISFEGSAITPLANVGISAPGRKPVIDGNGSNMTGYTYNSSGTLYPAVGFEYCIDPYAINIRANNGLVNCLLFNFCRNPVHIDCDGTNAVYDNGISVNYFLDYTGYAANDPETWCNAKGIRPRAWGNRGVGITNYGAVGYYLEGPMAWANGNDTVDAGYTVWGGGISIEANFGGGGYETRDSKTVIVSPRCFANHNYGIYVGAKGVKIVDPVLDYVIKPVARTEATGTYGSHILAVGLATVTITGADLRNAECNGVVALATVHGKPAVRFDGEISNSGVNGVYGRGIEKLFVSEKSEISDSAEYGVLVDNSGGADYNQGLGTLDVRGKIERSGLLAVGSDYVGTVRTNVDLKDNRLGTTSGSMVRARNAVTADLQAINRDANSKTTKIVEVASTCTYGRARGSGDATTPHTAVENSAATPIFTAGENLGYDLVLEDRANATVAGGAASAGKNTRPLGTTLFNRRTLATSISAGNFTLPAGTYLVRAWAQAYKVDDHTLYLEAVSGGTNLMQGSTEFADAAGTVPTRSNLDGVITLAASTQLRLAHYCQTSRATDGLGKAMTTQPGRFAFIGIRKLA